ncbi:DUF6191 domain-containing protein [Streptomyces sp. JJ36]|uniref:DUF6191 domain-containing protein n=1 Tax=Streptomyces sp. JJ36 TaxID=2736645 RepID=UPI001F2B9E19|nr:DUF6191 domain-containing protein [Streptomyces sp. JJ36]MCF6522394.1 hypothetical protein [Streptomyces sp. JJ36]
MLDLSQELFNPSAKHTEDERQRLDHTRMVEGDHGPGCGPVDLDSGTVVIASQTDAVLPPRPRPEEDSATTADPGDAGDA